MLRRVAAVVLAGFMSSLFLWAEENGACRQDVETFCKDSQPGGGRVINCLKDHESALSAGCRGAL